MNALKLLAMQSVDVVKNEDRIAVYNGLSNATPAAKSSQKEKRPVEAIVHFARIIAQGKKKKNSA